MAEKVDEKSGMVEEWTVVEEAEDDIEKVDAEEKRTRRRRKRRGDMGTGERTVEEADGDIEKAEAEHID